MEDKVTRRIKAAGAEFDLVDMGEGPRILFLHGALGDYRTFAPHVRILAARFRALTYTQRHFGPGPWPADGPAFGTAEHADDLIAVIEALNLAPVHLVAWSYVGHVALTAARARPELFAGILIYESGFSTFMTDKDEIRKFQEAMTELFGPISEAVARADYPAAIRALIDGSSREKGYFDAQSDRSRQIELENAHTMPLLMSQTPPARISAADLGALKVPVTIAVGERTHPAYRLVADAAMAAIGGDAHRIVGGQNHFWPDRDPRGFARFIADWINTSRPRKPA